MSQLFKKILVSFNNWKLSRRVKGTAAIFLSASFVLFGYQNCGKQSLPATNSTSALTAANNINALK